MESKLKNTNILAMAPRRINHIVLLAAVVFSIFACQQNSAPKTFSAEELTFEMITGTCDLQKTVKGRKAVEGGVTLDYITKTMTIEKGRFNTYTTSHIPWGSKYQTELKGDTLHVYNGTSTTFLTFKVILSRDGKSLILENLNEDEQEFYIKK